MSNTNQKKKPWELPPEELAQLAVDFFHNSPEEEETPKSEEERFIRDAEDGYFEDD